MAATSPRQSPILNPTWMKTATAIPISTDRGDNDDVADDQDGDGVPHSVDDGDNQGHRTPDCGWWD